MWLSSAVTSWFTGEAEPQQPLNYDPTWELPGLPSPTSREEFDKLNEEAFNLINGWITGTQSEGWAPILPVEEGIELFEKETSESGVHIIKCRGVICSVTCEELFELHWSTGLEERKRIAEDLLESKVLQKFSDTMKLTYSAWQSPVGVANRDFVSLRCHKKFPDGSILMYGIGVNSKDQPMKEGFVRGVNKQGLKFVPHKTDPTKCLLITVDYLDPKGWVPGMIVNMFKRKPCERILRLRAEIATQRAIEQSKLENGDKETVNSDDGVDKSFANCDGFCDTYDESSTSNSTSTSTTETAATETETATSGDTFSPVGDENTTTSTPTINESTTTNVEEEEEKQQPKEEETFV